MTDCKPEEQSQDKPEPTASPDQEVWVRDRILTAMRMALAMRHERRVRADEQTFECAILGIAEGTAAEVIRTLDLNVGYVNLMNPYLAPVASNKPEAIQPLEPGKGLGG